ncbi:MAG: phosphonate C-P lyase system protein PhnH [Syntrophorhabdaceae bacterium]|nr:phosphonate C-P lyase system protein PhnH [Syntrophorhabdaceae bacterium]
MNNEIVFKTQRIYRIILQAMAHPGRIYNLFKEIQHQGLFLPEPFMGLFYILETLLDGNVSFTVINDPNGYTKEIEIITRSQFKDISEADFIIIFEGKSDGAIIKAKKGSPEYPDDSATVIYTVHSCSNENKKGTIFLSGPGIKKATYLTLTGLFKEELDVLMSLRGDFPCGIDLIFIDPFGNIACIPRSATMKEVL